MVETRRGSSDSLFPSTDAANRAGHWRQPPITSPSTSLLVGHLIRLPIGFQGKKSVEMRQRCSSSFWGAGKPITFKGGRRKREIAGKVDSLFGRCCYRHRNFGEEEKIANKSSSTASEEAEEMQRRMSTPRDTTREKCDDETQKLPKTRRQTEAVRSREVGAHPRPSPLGHGRKRFVEGSGLTGKSFFGGGS